MAVQEQQAGAAAASQGEGDAEQDGAVPAEHDRERAFVEDGADGVSEPGCVVAQPLGVEQTGAGVDRRVEGRGSQPSAAPGTHPLGEPGREQDLGQALDPGGAQAQVGGRFDDHTGRHRGPPTGTTDTAAKSVLQRASTGNFRFNLVAPTAK